MAILFYYALLAVWPLLLLPALRLGGLSRAWLLTVALAGLLATVHEISLLYGPPADIRLDVPLIAAVLAGLYATAAVVMFGSKWRKSAAALAIVLLLSGSGMAYAWIEAGREADRLSAIFEARNALLFAAKFRSAETYRDYFQMSDTAQSPFPAGHWQAEGGGYFSRLVINPQGRVWAFFPCGATQCEFNSGDNRLQPVGGAAGRRWEIMLDPPTGAPATVRITQTGPDTLTIEGPGQPSLLIAAPPPVDPAPAPAPLTFLGPFAQMTCRRPHADIRQLWLWRDGTRLYAVGIFSVLLAGAEANYVTPTVLGESVRSGDGWSFTWQQGRRSWQARVTLDGPGARLTLQRDDAAAVTLVLERGAIIRDEAVELAPLTGKADWNRWFDTVLVGHFSTGNIPAC